MEFSDNEEEEVVDLNDDKNKEKGNDKKEKSKSKNSSSKNLKWVKKSYDSISQMITSEIEENEYSELNNEFQNEENQKNENYNEDDNQDNASDYNNDEKNNVNYNKNSKNNDFIEKTNETNEESNSVKNKINYIFIWDEGGDNVKLIGSFSNWKQQYEMEKDEKDKIYKFSLFLNNEKYQYKFIVDGVWKYSKNQTTIDDGKGNINNILDLTNVKQEKEAKKKNISKKSSKIKNKKEIKEKKKRAKEKGKEKEKKESESNIKKEKKKIFKKSEYGNIYPDQSKLSEPNNANNIGKSFNINNESKQGKIGNHKYYKFQSNNCYSCSKSYLNISTYRHTILNHILLQKKIKKKTNKKIGITYRYREKATTVIYYNLFSIDDGQ